MQHILCNVLESNIEEISSQIEEILEENRDNIDIFFRSIFSIIPARINSLEIYSMIIISLRHSSDDFFLSVLKKYLSMHLSTANHEVTAIFIAYLIKANIIGIGQVIDIVQSVIQSHQRLQSDVLIQVIICLFNCAQWMHNAPQDELEDIFAFLRTRKELSNEEKSMDPNSVLFDSYYDELIAVKYNTWNIPDNLTNKDLIVALINDDSNYIRQGIDDGSIDPNMKLIPTVLCPHPMLTFNPPIVSAAAFFGSINCFKELKDAGASLTEVDDENRSVLHFACAGGSQDIVDLVRDECADYSGSLATCIDFFRYNLMEHVYSIYNIPSLDYGFDDFSDNIVHMAARNNWIYALENFQNAGISLESYDEYHWTPIHVAASNGSYEFVQLLLRYGVNPNVKDFDANTPIQCAAMEGDVKMMQILLSDSRTNLHAVDHHGANALHWAATHNRADAINFLLSFNEVNPNATDFGGRTPLSLACSGKCCDAIEVFASNQNVEVNTTDIEGKSPLHIAVEGKSVSTVRSILRFQNIDLEKEVNGKTAVEIAASQNSLEIVRVLIDAGSDISSIRANINEYSYEIAQLLE